MAKILPLLVLLACATPDAREEGSREQPTSQAPCGAARPELTDSALQSLADSANTLAGRVCVEETGAPVSGARVALLTDGREWAAGTDSGGTYQLEGIPQGDLRVVVRALGYYPEERALTIGGCGYRLIGDAAGADTGLRDVNPATCRRHQWLAFYMRPLPQY